jgi:hypothetical protein
VRRFLFTLLTVVGLSMLISGSEQAGGVSPGAKDWVRTADGWESRHVVQARPRMAAPALHPGLVAAFQLGASVFCLLAFPAQVVALDSIRRRSTG